MAAEVRNTCPDCGSLDVEVKTALVVVAGDSVEDTARCANCAWEGPASQIRVFATTQQLWDIERVGSVALRVISKHAAGPLVQLWEFVGILPRSRQITREVTGKRKKAANEYNNKVNEVRGEVMREVFAAALEAAFNTAAKAREKYPELWAEPIDRTPSETSPN